MKKLFLIPAFVLALTVNGYAYDSRATLSADQLFDNSMKELRGAMRNARESNQELKEQNRLLRREAAKLEGALSGLQEIKGVEQAEEDPSVSNNNEDFAQQERNLYQARLENLSARHDRLNAQTQRMQKSIDFYVRENQETQDRIASLKKEVSDIQFALAPSKKPVNTKVVAVSPKIAQELASRLASRQEQIRTLQKKLALQKNALNQKLADRDKVESGNAAFEAQLASGAKDLERLRAGVYVPERSKGSNYSLARQEIADLEDRRDQLRASVNDLNKASASIKSSRAVDLEKVLKIYKEQQALLKEKLAALDTGDSLRARKQNLALEKSRLVDQIAQAQKGDASGDLKAQLKQSTDRVFQLKEQMIVTKSSSPLKKKYNDLSGQVAVLEQDLQNLRENPQIALPKSAQEIKEEIVQMEARRVVLAKSVQEIYDKYNMKELPTNKSLAKENQMNEYFETLRVENTALQQKLLTLQMRKEKNLPTIQ